MTFTKLKFAKELMVIIKIILNDRSSDG